MRKRECKGGLRSPLFLTTVTIEDVERRREMKVTQTNPVRNGPGVISFFLRHHKLYIKMKRTCTHTNMYNQHRNKKPKKKNVADSGGNNERTSCQIIKEKSITNLFSFLFFGQEKKNSKKISKGKFKNLQNMDIKKWPSEEQ